MEWSAPCKHKLHQDTDIWIRLWKWSDVVVWQTTSKKCTPHVQQDYVSSFIQSWRYRCPHRSFSFMEDHLPTTNRNSMQLILNPTLACLRYLKNISSSGNKRSKAWPRPSFPRAVRPTRWIYSWNKNQPCMTDWMPGFKLRTIHASMTSKHLVHRTQKFALLTDVITN